MTLEFDNGRLGSVFERSRGRALPRSLSSKKGNNERKYARNG